MKKQTNIRMSEATRKKLDKLTESYGTQAETIAVSVDRLYVAHNETPKRENVFRELANLWLVYSTEGESHIKTKDALDLLMQAYYEWIETD